MFDAFEVNINLMIKDLVL